MRKQSFRGCKTKGFANMEKSMIFPATKLKVLWAFKIRDFERFNESFFTNLIELDERFYKSIRDGIF